MTPQTNWTFFYAFFPEELIQKLVARQTGSRFKVVLIPGGNQPQFLRWKPSLLMTIIDLPTYKHYWSTDWLFKTSIPSIMPRARFEKLFQYFHTKAMVVWFVVSRIFPEGFSYSRSELNAIIKKPTYLFILLIKFSAPKKQVGWKKMQMSEILTGLPWQIATCSILPRLPPLISIAIAASHRSTGDYSFDLSSILYNTKDRLP